MKSFIEVAEYIRIPSALTFVKQLMIYATHILRFDFFSSSHSAANTFQHLSVLLGCIGMHWEYKLNGKGNPMILGQYGCQNMDSLKVYKRLTPKHHGRVAGESQYHCLCPQESCENTKTVQSAKACIVLWCLSKSLRSQKCQDKASKDSTTTPSTSKHYTLGPVKRGKSGEKVCSRPGPLKNISRFSKKLQIFHKFAPNFAISLVEFTFSRSRGPSLGLAAPSAPARGRGEVLFTIEENKK